MVRERKPPIIIGQGPVGRLLREQFPDSPVITRDLWDIATTETPQEVLDMFDEHDAVIHCAGMNNRETNKNERTTVEAMRVNVGGLINVVTLCASQPQPMHIFFISTEYVFGGMRLTSPFGPDDPPCPVTPYGKTKAAAEYVVSAYKPHAIIRLSAAPIPFPYEAAYTDVISSKLPLTKACAEIAELVEARACGRFHVCGDPRSVYAFVVAHGEDVRPTTVAIDSQPRDIPRDSSLRR